MASSSLRSEKLDLRLTPGAKQTLQRAATAAQRTLPTSCWRARWNCLLLSSRQAVDEVVGFHILVLGEVCPG